MNKRTLLLLLLFSVALAFYSQNAFADGSYACSYSGDCSDTGTSPFSGSGCYPSDLTGTYTAVCKLGVTYSCSYCSNGCSGGACNPAPACIPSCSGDQCGQNNGCGGSCPSTDASTPGKCGNPATPKDPCAGVTCSTPPAATCSGSNRVTYSSSGTCSNGACSYSSSSTYCAYGCSAGACNPEPAASKPLAQPATSVCGNGATESGEECDDGLSTTSGTRYCSTGIVSYDACINCKSQPAPECQTPKCTPNEEVSRSCSGCKTTTLTMCNSDGTATYQLPNQYASECTSGCPTQAPQTCIDNDKDGYWQRTSTCTAGTDCNDNNAAINLGVTEPSCDSDTIDNDCKNGDAPACSTETVAACTPSAWSCTLPTECPSTGFKTSTCTLIDTTCTNPEAAKPATTTQSCTPPPQCGSENEKCCTANTCNTGLNCIENKVGYTIISAVCKKTAQQTVPACIDNDGDGYGSNCAKGTDCNDNNPAINPAASEPACDSDNIDNNCDGLDAPACTTTTTPTPTPTPVCGDNTCNGPETTASCPADCKELKTDIAVTGLTVSTSYPSIIIPKVIKNVNEVVDFEFTVLNTGETTITRYAHNLSCGYGRELIMGVSNVEILPLKETTNGFSCVPYNQTGLVRLNVNVTTQGDSNPYNNIIYADIYIVNPDENNVIKKDGYFVLGNTYLMQYVGADALTTNNPSATSKFKNVATGEILEVATGSVAGSIKIGGATYFFASKTDPKYADYDIIVDLNGDGKIVEIGEAAEKPVVVFTVNGKPTPEFSEGGIFSLADGTGIGIFNIIAERFAGGVREVTFFLGAVRDVLSEGESKSYTMVSGKTYDVVLDFVGSTTASFTVNEQPAKLIPEGSTYTLSDGSQIGVKKITAQNFAGGVRKAEFFLGAVKGVLREGKSGTYTVNGKTYEIEASFIGSEDEKAQTGPKDETLVCPSRIDVSFDKDTYRAGDTMTLTIKVYDEKGKLVSADLNAYAEIDGVPSPKYVTTIPSSGLVGTEKITVDDGKIHTYVLILGESDACAAIGKYISATASIRVLPSSVYAKAGVSESKEGSDEIVKLISGAKQAPPAPPSPPGLATRAEPAAQGGIGEVFSNIGKAINNFLGLIYG